jgi:molecular chaperone HtpG
MMQTLSEENPEDYTKFYTAFNKNIKLGVHEDSKNRDKLSKLLRYKSLNHRDKAISLDDYIKEMKYDQPNIFYIGGESIKAVENSLFLEKVKLKGYDVLFFTDPIDEYILQQLKEFDGKKLISVASKSLKIDEDDEKTSDFKEEFEGLSKKMKEILDDKVQNVTLSTRVIDSPSCLVTDDHGYSANMQRIMKAQALNNSEMMSFMMGRKDLEINPKHKIIKALNKKFQENNEDTIVVNLTTLLYDVALLTSGFTIEEPSSFAKKFNNMIELGLSIDEEDDDVEEVEDDVEKVEDENVVTEAENDTESTMEQVD